MPTPTELLDYARECMIWAEKARTEDEREACIALARGWTEAALAIKGAIKRDGRATRKFPARGH